MSRKDIVNQISQAIRRVDPTATAILYGSEARGDARPDSDIDVLILLDGDQMSLKREMDMTGPLNEIEWQTGVLVSPTVMLRKQWENMPFKTPFYINVMNEGKKNMKETLDEQSRISLTRYRMDRADEAIEEAALMSERGHYNAAVNRLYYACFYAVQALLLKHHIAATTHAGVKAMLGLHFVSKGVISIEHGKTFNTLFEKRHSSDYEAFAYCDKALVDDLTPLAEAFISQIKELLNQDIVEP